MMFSTQVCTTCEQSERLLALGLKEETADMFHLRVIGDSEDDFDRNNFAECTESVYDRHYYPREDVIPDWSFDRMFAMFPKDAHNEYGNLSFKWEYSNNKYHFYVLAKYAPMELLLKKHSNDLYELAISALEWLVKGDFIDKQYLNESL